MVLAREESPYYQEFIEFITSSPSLEAIANYRLSEQSEARLSQLLENNRKGILSADEQAELDDYIRLEHIMRMIKYRSYEKLARQ